MKVRNDMLEFHGFDYELIHGNQVKPDRDVQTRTVQVEVKETQRRVIDVELPIDMKETAAEDLVALMYDRGEIYLNSEDHVVDAEVNLL